MATSRVVDSRCQLQDSLGTYQRNHGRRKPAYWEYGKVVCDVTGAHLTYADAITKQFVERWGADHGSDAPTLLRLHIEARFGARAIKVTDATEDAGNLILQIESDKWEHRREFGLLPNGSLAW